MAEPRKMDPKIKMAVDFGPLLIFFVAFYTRGIMEATAAIVIATLIALAVSYAIEHKLALMPLISGILITVFGGATLILQDPIYLIIKATFFYVLISSALSIGLAFDKPLIKHVMGHTLQLPHDAWRNLTFRWIGFFVFLAVANLFVWRIWGLEVWVNFKAWGAISAVFIFTMAQMPFIMKNQIEPETTD